jgi:hypothetical protein
MKIVRIFFYRIRDRIHLEGFKFIRIRVWIFNIRYRIHIRILKSYIYDVDIQSYPIWHGWHYPYSNPNPDGNIKTNIISVISVRILPVFILTEPALTTGQLGHSPSRPRPCLVFKNFLFVPSHRIFGCMYGALNIDKKITNCTVWLKIARRIF